jgi:lipid A ethanolaminephosphotransferase
LSKRTVGSSPFAFALLVSLALVAFYNWRFWTETVAAAHPAAIEDFLFLASLAVILFLAHAALLLLMPGRRSLRIAAAGLFLIAAVAAFFVDSYDVVIDKEMIRNIFETDRREASAFLIPRFGLYLTLLGVIPAIIVLRAPLVAPSLSHRLTQRLGFFEHRLEARQGRGVLCVGTRRRVRH